MTRWGRSPAAPLDDAGRLLGVLEPGNSLHCYEWDGEGRLPRFSRCPMTIPDLTHCKQDPTLLDRMVIKTDHGQLTRLAGLAFELRRPWLPRWHADTASRWCRRWSEFRR